MTSSTRTRTRTTARRSEADALLGARTGPPARTRLTRPAPRRSECEQLVTQRLVLAQLRRGAAEPDRSLLQHVHAIREGQREVDPLFREQDRESFALESIDLLLEMGHDE